MVVSIPKSIEVQILTTYHVNILIAFLIYVNRLPIPCILFSLGGLVPTPSWRSVVEFANGFSFHCFSKRSYPALDKQIQTLPVMATCPSALFMRCLQLGLGLPQVLLQYWEQNGEWWLLHLFTLYSSRNLLPPPRHFYISPLPFWVERLRCSGAVKEIFLHLHPTRKLFQGIPVCSGALINAGQKMLYWFIGIDY